MTTTATVQTQLQERIDNLKVQLKDANRRRDYCAADLATGELIGLNYALRLMQKTSTTMTRDRE